MDKEAETKAHRARVILLLTRACHNRNDNRSKISLINEAKGLIKKHWK